jgi:hypothetical protein
LAWLQDELQQLRRFMLYCRGLKFKKAEVQARYWMDNTNIREYSVTAIIMQRHC